MKTALVKLEYPVAEAILYSGYHWQGPSCSECGTFQYMIREILESDGISKPTHRFDYWCIVCFPDGVPVHKI